MSGHLKYIPHIDGLRAVAVLAVITYHLNPAFLPGGFTGVDVFFVISGFVVSGSVAGLEGIGLGAFLKYFYARRVFRIGPALVACLLVTTLVFALFIPMALQSRAIQRAGLSAFFGLSNFSLARTEHDYFAPMAGLNPFTHTWSLGIEEQFYLLFPWIFIPFLAGRKQLSIGLAMAGFLVSMGFAAWLGMKQPALAFYMIISRFWELAAGVLLFQLSTRADAPRERSILAAWGASAAAVVLAAGLATARPDSTPFPGGILPSLGTVGLLGLLPASSGPVRGMLEHKVFRFIGRISYSLYLWHWPVFVFFRWTAGLRSWPCYVAALVVTFGLAVASYYWVETPPRRWLGSTRITRGKAAIAGVVALVAGYGVAQGVWAAQPVISQSTVARHAGDWYAYGADTNAAYPGCRIESRRVMMKTGSYWDYSRAGCDTPVTFPHRILAIGDSHSFAYEAMLKQITMTTGAETAIYWEGGCAFIGVAQPPASGCVAFDAQAMRDVLRRVRPGDVVFLASRRVPVGETAGLAANAAAALPLLKPLSEHGAVTVFEAMTPEFGSPAFRCADWYDRHNPACLGDMEPRKVFEALRAPVLAEMAKLQNEVPHVYVWDPAAALCDADTCFQYLHGRPLFFDENHLSGYGDAVLEPGFMRFIRRAEGQ